MFFNLGDCFYRDLGLRSQLKIWPTGSWTISAGSLGLRNMLESMTLTKWFYPTRLETRTKESR